MRVPGRPHTPPGRICLGPAWPRLRGPAQPGTWMAGPQARMRRAARPRPPCRAPPIAVSRPRPRSARSARHAAAVEYAGPPMPCAPSPVTRCGPAASGQCATRQPLGMGSAHGRGAKSPSGVPVQGLRGVKVRQHVRSVANWDTTTSARGNSPPGGDPQMPGEVAVQVGRSRTQRPRRAGKACPGNPPAPRETPRHGNSDSAERTRTWRWTSASRPPTSN